MKPIVDCPRCRRPMSPSPDLEGTARCATCGGIFVPVSESRRDFFEGAGDSANLRGASSAPPEDSPTSPGCGATMASSTGPSSLPPGPFR